MAETPWRGTPEFEAQVAAWAEKYGVSIEEARTQLDETYRASPKYISSSPTRTVPGPRPRRLIRAPRGWTRAVEGALRTGGADPSDLRTRITGAYESALRTGGADTSDLSKLVKDIGLENLELELAEWEKELGITPQGPPDVVPDEARFIDEAEAIFTDDSLSNAEKARRLKVVEDAWDDALRGRGRPVDSMRGNIESSLRRRPGQVLRPEFQQRPTAPPVVPTPPPVPEVPVAATAQPTPKHWSVRAVEPVVPALRGAGRAAASDLRAASMNAARFGGRALREAASLRGLNYSLGPATLAMEAMPIITTRGPIPPLMRTAGEGSSFAEEREAERVAQERVRAARGMTDAERKAQAARYEEWGRTDQDVSQMDPETRREYERFKRTDAATERELGPQRYLEPGYQPSWGRQRFELPAESGAR